MGGFFCVKKYLGGGINMIKEAIIKLSQHQNLNFDTSEAIINEIMNGKATNAQITGFLTALAMKEATVDEIAGAAKAMREHALAFDTKKPTLEIVGTGGDHSNSFNISTTTAFVVAAAGIPVTKHGNRAASSKSGAADVLEALGVKIDDSPQQSEAILEQIGMAFMFAQEYHQAMRYVAPARKELGIATIFNILGPLANPANASMQLLGVYDEKLIEPLAHVLDRLGIQSAMVVYGRDGLDEISSAAGTDVMEVHNGTFKTYQITPEQFGLKRSRPEELVGGTAMENAQITRAILANQQGAPRDAVLMNAVAAIHIAKPELSLAEGFDIAKTTLESGAAETELNNLVRLSQEVFSH